MKKYLKSAYTSLALLSMTLPVSALALTTPTPPVTGTPVTLPEIEDRIRQVAQFLIVVSLIVAVIYIIVGGIMWMAAGGDPAKAQKAKDRIWHGVFGAIIVLAVGVILQTLAGVITRSFFG